MSTPIEMSGAEAAAILNVGQDAHDHDVPERGHAALLAIVRLGYSVRFVEWGEDSETPGMLGTIRGVTSHTGRWVKIATKPHAGDPEALADTIEHELHHVADPLWDCGSRNVYGNRVPVVSDPGYLALRTARKAWTCTGCGAEIAKGQRYVENLSETPAFRSGDRYCGRCSMDRGYLSGEAS